tara:strand:+ start:500 stop:739 length:240 start_codon:yes stop_codon:yes gene_type:complete
MKVEIYTKDNCVWCTRAKNLMSDLQISYLEHDLSDDDERKEFYKRIGEGVSTVPQVYINGNRIGGYKELSRWLESNGNK